MAGTDRKVTFIIGANITGFMKGLDKSTTKFQKFGKDLSRIGASLQTKVSLPILGIGVAAGKAAVDFESAFAGVRKTVNATETQFSQLKKGILDMSRELPTSSSEIAKIAENAGQLGIEADNILAFTKTMVMLGDTTNIVGEEAAMAFARIAKIMGLPQTQFDRMGSTVVELGNNFETTESEIVSFANRLSGVGKIAGLSVANILGISTALSSVGVEAESGSTSVQKALFAINEAVINGGSELEGFAKTARLSSKEFASLWKENSAEAFTLFVEGLGKDGNRASITLSDLGLNSERLKRAFLSLAGAGDSLRKAIDSGNKAWQENTALTKEANERYKTTLSFWSRAKNSVIALGASFDGQLLKPIRDVSQAVINVSTNLSNLSDDNKQKIVDLAMTIATIPVAIYAIGKAIVLTAAIAKGAVVAFGALKALIIGITASTLPLWAVFAGLAVIFAEVVVAGQWMVDNWYKISKGISNSLLSISISFEQMVGRSLLAIKKLTDFLIGDGTVAGSLGRFLGIDVTPLAGISYKIDKAVSDISDSVMAGRKELESGILLYEGLEWTSIGESASNALKNSKTTMMQLLDNLLEGTGLKEKWNEFMSIFNSNQASSVNGIDEITASINNLQVSASAIPNLDLSKMFVDAPEATSNMNGLNKETKETSDALKIATDIGNTFTDSFGYGMANVIVQGERLVDTLRNIGRLLASSIIQKGLSILLTGGLSGTGLFGSGGGLLGRLFSGLGFANGGVPPVGKASIVGERGPELFLPSVRGTIVPNHQLSTGLIAQDSFSSGGSVKPKPLPSGAYTGGGISERSLVNALNGVKWVQRGSDLVAVINSYSSGMGR